MSIIKRHCLMEAHDIGMGYFSNEFWPSCGHMDKSASVGH